MTIFKMSVSLKDSFCEVCSIFFVTSLCVILKPLKAGFRGRGLRIMFVPRKIERLTCACPEDAYVARVAKTIHTDTKGMGYFCQECLSTHYDHFCR